VVSSAPDAHQTKWPRRSGYLRAVVEGKQKWHIAAGARREPTTVQLCASGCARLGIGAGVWERIAPGRGRKEHYVRPARGIIKRHPCRARQGHDPPLELPVMAKAPKRFSTEHGESVYGNCTISADLSRNIKCRGMTNSREADRCGWGCYEPPEQGFGAVVDEKSHIQAFSRTSRGLPIEERRPVRYDDARLQAQRPPPPCLPATEMCGGKVIVNVTVGIGIRSGGSFLCAPWTLSFPPRLEAAW